MSVDLSRQSPHTIYLLGPNHFDLGAPIVSNRLLSFGLNQVSLDIITRDHAVTPIKEILHQQITSHPQVIPILLSHRLSSSQLDLLIKFLSARLSQGHLIIASIDFSHYQTLQVANLRDSQTKKLILAKSYPQLAQLSDQYLDSPPSLLALMKSLDSLGQYQINIQQNTNSETILSTPNLPSTTSHMLITFTP